MATHSKNISNSQRLARRTAWILGGIAVTMFVLSIVQQLALVHHL